MNSDKNSIAHILVFTLAISLTLGTLVSLISVMLQPVQEQNRSLERQRLLQELLLQQPGFENIATQNASYQMTHRLVELSSGCYDNKIAPEKYASVADPDTTEFRKPLSSEQDRARIGYRSKYALVHLIHNDDALVAVILPVYGLGYMSRLSAYLTLGADVNTIRSLVFYQHNETPGMGGRISDQAWQAKWGNKRLRDDSGNIRIGVATAVPTKIPDQPYQIDAMTGATTTGRGVTSLLQFWAGPMGYGPFLTNLNNQADCVR